MTSASVDRRPARPARTAPPTAARRLLIWLPVALVGVALVLTHAYAALGAGVPVYWEDEAGYLGNAQVLAGVGEAPDLRGRPYYIGWSLLLVPLWWMLGDGAAVYQGAVWLAALCGIATAVPLALIARRLGLGWPAAWLAGGVIALSPTRTVMSGFGFAENFLTLLIAVSVLLALRFAARPDWSRALALGLVVGLVFATHGRMVPLLGATGLWFAWCLVRRRVLPGLIGLGSMGLVAGGLFLLYRQVAGQLYGSSGERESTGVGRLLTPDLMATALSGLGQIWYLVFAWLGLTVLGIVAIARLTGAELRRRRPSVGVWAAITLLGSAVISFTFNSPTIERGASRLDIYSYGRYLDPLVVPLALVGLVLVLRVLSRRTALVLLAGTVAVAAAWFAIVWPAVPDEGRRWWAPINVPAILQFGWPGTPSLPSSIPEWLTRLPAAPWFAVTGFVLVAVVLVVLLRRRPIVPALLLALYFAASSVIIGHWMIRPFFAPWNESYTLTAELRDDPVLGGEPVTFDSAGAKEAGDVTSRNAYQILLAPSRVELIDSTTADPATELVIARPDWPRAAELGAVKVTDDPGVFANTLWVLPGELQDELIEAGRIAAPTP